MNRRFRAGRGGSWWALAGIGLWYLVWSCARAVLVHRQRRELKRLALGGRR